MPASPRILRLSAVLQITRRGGEVLGVLKHSHYAAETAAQLHYYQVCVALVGAFGDDCHEALKDRERPRDDVGLANTGAERGW
jgi:hypothetical protein